LAIRGQTTGGKVTKITWIRNGINVSRTTELPNGKYYDGGGELLRNFSDCTRKVYRYALLVTGYLPGEYLYIASNNYTPEPITSPIFILQG